MQEIVKEILNELLSRHENLEPFCRKESEFPSLKIERREFLSLTKETLRNYVFSNNNSKVKAILVLAHGLGIGGAFCYLDIINYFVNNGFMVFAYDATGNAESGGTSCISIEQGVIDLSEAINYVEKDKIIGQYPIVLFGHSWGAYAVSAVIKFHKEVKAVCEVAAFNDVESEFKYQLEYLSLSKDEVQKGFIELLNENERNVPTLFKNVSAMDGFDNSNAKIFLVHGAKDINVIDKLGYDLFFKKYKDNKRFVFKHYLDRSHFDLYYSDKAREYRNSYDDKNGYSNFNKAIACELDLSLMNEIKEFYLFSINNKK